MLHKTAVKLTDRLIKSDVILKEKAAIYRYGFELLLSCIIGIAVLICLSCVYGNPFIWIPYMMAYVPLRTNAGGYHAGSHFRCISFFSLVFFVSLYIMNWLCKFRIFPVVCSALALAAILIFSPVIVTENPLTEKRKIICRKRSIVICCINMLEALCTLWLNGLFRIFFTSYYMGVTVAFIFMLIAVIINTINGGCTNESKSKKMDN